MKRLQIKEILKFIFPIFLLMIVSFLIMYNVKFILDGYKYYLMKQIIYYILGYIIMFLVIKFNYKYIYDNIFIFYVIMNIILLSLLFFGNSINGAKAWINLGFISIQPSEFMKIILLIYLSKVFYLNKSSDFKLILKTFIIVLIPSLLTFLEPDTGTVLFYIIMWVFMLIYYDLNKWWYTAGVLVILLLGSCFGYLYFFNQDLFIKIFGTSFFYRMDRLVNFMNSTGYQINNALIGIGNGGMFGLGIDKFHIYFPEAVTDFAFALVLTDLGFITGLFVIILFIYLDILLLKNLDIVNYDKKYFIIGFLGIFLYQQLEHIMMNLGLLPITGITLPFISYGGSSLISYFICFGIILNFKLKKFLYELVKKS